VTGGACEAISADVKYIVTIVQIYVHNLAKFLCFLELSSGILLCAKGPTEEGSEVQSKE
jgi:hypothetical protein